MAQIHVVIRNGRAVISFPTYWQARQWVSGREDSLLYTIDYVQLKEAAEPPKV